MIFVSYSRHDKSICDEIVRALKEHGHEVWVDREAIRGGDVWRANIENAIENSDAFIILLSSNLSDMIQGELELAHKHHKKIIAVRLKSQKKLPQGYDLILSGRQHIEMTNFDSGIQQLLDALGEANAIQLAPPKSLWGRAIRKAQHVRAVVANSNLGPTTLKLGAAALTGAAAVAVAVASRNVETRKESMKKYQASIERILGSCTHELDLTRDMSADAYKQEFRPRMQRLLGQLEATSVPTNELKRHHADLLMNLQRTIDEYDQGVLRLEGGDVGSYRRAVSRVVAAFSATLKAYVELLEKMN